MDSRQQAVFGRREELSMLASFLDDAQTSPSALLLAGEAGVGKSTLWKEGLRSAAERSFRVLHCRPVESEAKLSFAALGDLFGDVIDEVDLALPPPQAKALDVALLRAEPEGAPPESRAVSMSVLGAIRALSEAEPLLVAVDDVQWLDPPSARVLEFALRRLATERVGILLALRGEWGSEAPFGLDRALPEDRLHRLAVGPLGLDALADLLRERLGTVFRRSTMVRLRAMSGGNAFFAIEIAMASIRGDEPATGQSLPVPNSLRELTRRRVVALSEGDRRVLLAVAALSAPTITAIDSDPELERQREALDRAVDAGLVQIEGEQVQFTHPLYGSAILSEASPGELRALHRRLSSVATDPEERARHLALGSEATDPVVATALEEAAGRARSRGAPDAAAELSEMALRLTPPDRAADRLERSFEAARHHVAAGDAPRARALLEAAVDAAPPGPLRARALLALGLILPVHASWTEAGKLFRRALDEAGEEAALRARIELGLGYASVFAGSLADAESHAQRALELAEAGIDVGDLAEALAFVAYVDFALGRGLRRDLLDRAVALEPQDEDHWVWDETRPSYSLAQLLERVGLVDEARSVLQALLDRASAQGREHPLSWLFFHLAELECWAGRWEIAEQHARRSHELAIQTGETGHVLAFASYALALVDALLGRADTARERASDALALAERIEIRTMRIMSLSVLGFLELFQGNAAGVDLHLQRAADLSAAMGIEEPMMLRFVPDHVEALVALGELDRARTALDVFEERAVRLDRPWALATGARCRGLLLAAEGDIQAALGSLARALEHHERVPEPFEVARTWFCLGRVQRRAKLKAEARASFERALGIYGELGARPWAERAGREARRVGVRAAGPLELTPTEERVAALVAEGRTNREAADALFMSVNTIEWNLSKIYRKLGVRSRTELAAKLRERT